MSTAMTPETALRLHAETAADLMASNPISLRAEAGVSEAAALFIEKGIAAAPVIDEAGHPIGVVSRSDLLVHQCEHEKHPAGEPDFFFAPTFADDETPRKTKGSAKSTMAELMTPAVFAVAPDTPVQRVINDMVGLRVHRLFVVDDAGILIGVISTMDILRHLKGDG